MDYHKLEKIIQESINPEGPLYLQVISKLQGLDDETQKSFLYHELSNGVKNELEHSNFYSQNYSWFLNLGNGALGFHPFMVAPRLIQLAIERNSPRHAIYWLKKIIESKYADGFCVMLLCGLEVDSCINFANDVSLMPLSDIPESKNKNWATNELTWFPSAPYHNNLGSPKSALVKKIRIQPYIYNSDNEPKNKETLKGHELLYETKQVLTLCGPSPVMQSVYWVNLEDPDLDYAQYHGGTSWKSYEVMPMKLEVFGKFCPEEAVKIVDSYFAIGKTQVKNRIVNAINRLSLAMRRRSPGDAAVELSIALECLFAEDRGENTYKIGLRVALLLGGANEDKITVRSIISNLYAVRSAMVHTGRQKNKSIEIKNKGKCSTDELVKEGCVICSRAIAKIIELKELPDWYEIELNK